MIYFPEVREAALEYSNGLVEHYEWMANAVELTGQPIGVMATSHPELQERMDQIDALRNNLEDTITKNAKRYTYT